MIIGSILNYCGEFSRIVDGIVVALMMAGLLLAVLAGIGRLNMSWSQTLFFV
jgi:hypothetical protein